MADLEAKLEALEAELKEKEKQYKLTKEKKLKELKAVQAKVREKQRKRAAKTRFLAGELCEMAGIAEIDRETLLGGLLELSAKITNPETASGYKKAGENFLISNNKK